MFTTNLHDELIDKMLALGYPANKEGMCLGIAAMAMQALLAGEDEFQIFQMRFTSILHTSKQELVRRKDELSAAQNEIKALNKKITEQEDELKGLRSHANHLIAALKKVENKAEESTLKESYKNIKQQYRSLHTSLERDRDLQATYARELEDTINILAFFDGVELYAQADLHPDFLDKSKEGRLSSQNILDVAPIVLSKKLADGVAEIGCFTGIYSQAELETYFDELKIRLADDLESPIAFILISSNHAITIGFDPKITGSPWRLIDANHLEASNRHFSSRAIADEVLTGFSSNNYTAFTTRVYAGLTNPQLESIRERIKDCENKTYERCNQEHSKWRDSYDASWLFLAASIGQEQVINLLLNNSDLDPNQATCGITPLYIAAQNGHKGVVKLLLNTSAVDPNQVTQGATPLFIAAEQGYVDIVDLLVEHGADKSIPFVTTPTKLLNFAQTKDYQVFEKVKEITARAETDIIQIIPYEIAEIFGNSAIQATLRPDLEKGRYTPRMFDTPNERKAVNDANFIDVQNPQKK